MILGVIPARWASSRFPGKPLAEIAGKPMLWHVYQRCVEANCLDRIVVATDDERIALACQQYGIESLMTLRSHATGTDRVAEVALRLGPDLVVNIQGDEPLIAPEAIRLVTRALVDGPHGVTNGYAELTDPADFVDTTVPKVVLRSDNTALYLSRAPIPYPKARIGPYYFQVCAYGFHSEALSWFATTTPGYVERMEGIELLRFLEGGRPVKMVQVPPSPVAVDSPEDLERARAILVARGKAYHGADASPPT